MSSVSTSIPGHPPLPRLHRLHRHWFALKGDRALPSPADFDILGVTELMGHLHIMGVEGAPPRFRFRLFGTRIAEIAGRDLTGRWVDEIDPPLRAQAVHAAFLTALQQRVPCYSRSDESYDLGSIEMHRLACPFSSNGTDIDRLYVCVEAIERRHFAGAR